MKKIIGFLASFLSALFCFSQDTITVQTLTYDSVGRDYMFEFPEDDGTTYEKVIMEYSMRCKGALVSTPSDRDRGCGEWDYSCNTYIEDDSRVDSIPATHPSHIISGFAGNTYSYTSQPRTNVTNTISEIEVEVATGDPSPFSVINEGKAGRVQYLYTSNELSSGGLTGQISGLSVNIESGVGGLDLLKVKLKETNLPELSEPLVFDEFDQAYFLDTDLETGNTKLQWEL